MLNTFTRKIGPIGLDIGHHSIKTLQLAQSGSHTSVVAAMQSPIKPNLTAEQRSEFISSTIKSMIEKGGFNGRSVISCISNEQLRIKSARIESTEEAAIEETIKTDLAGRFGLDTEKDSIKYMVAGNVQQAQGMRNELLLFAVDNELIKSHIGMLEQAGLVPAGIDIVPCALFRSYERQLRREEDKDVVNVFVDVGSQFTTVVVARGRVISFVKQIPVGGDRFNVDVAVKLGIDSEQAASLRGRLSCDADAAGLDEATRQTITDSMQNGIEQLAKEIALCFRYYSVTFRGCRPGKAVFSGGEAYETNLISALNRQLGIEIEMAQPLRGFDLSRIEKGQNQRAMLCEWAIAAGLSLKGWTLQDDRETQHERN